MFTIDLLKGKGVPAKTRPRNIAVGAAVVAVPVIIAIAMFSLYLRNKVVISIQKDAVANFKTKISDTNTQHRFNEMRRTLEKTCAGIIIIS